MLILTCSTQLLRLEGLLRKSLPFTLPVYGAVMNINRGNPGEYEVVVDSWPEFGAILARRRGEVAAGDMLWGAWGAHSDHGVCQGASWLGTGGAGAHLGQELGCWRMLGAGMRLGSGVTVSSLSPLHLELLNKTWPYGGTARSRRYLADLLERFPHLCLQDAAGQPLCWALTDQFGAGTHGYTLPAHRRRGLMQAALTFAARRAQNRGFPTYG
ncbi:GLYL3 protein, partial [Eubucco bourcierii]|nr:GLYL3 protein [Eubucco bourcierii]